MATLANIFSRFTVAAVADTAKSQARTIDASCRLRALPNEDVYFFVKRIDNSRVVLKADPKARVRDNKVVVSGIAAAAIMIATLLPSAYGLIAGYQVNQLQTEHARLLNEKAKLELEEAKLVSPDRLQELAHKLKMEAPSPDRIVHVNGPDAALAMVRR